MAFFTCRVSLIPRFFQQSQLPEVFSGPDRAAITHTSLALGTDGITQTATVTFRNKPSVLSRLTNTVEYISHKIICSVEGRPVECSVRIDVGFRGLTPLNTTLDDNAVVLVAVTGLAGRAFGSWQASNGSMWLRDFLPKDVAHLRTFTYGYPSSLFKSLSTAGLLDFTLNFMDELKTYLRASKTRRLILVGHSLGCLIIKQALCECGARSFHELERAVLAVIFFGPPHRGLNNPKLQECVFGTPPEKLVQDMRKGSSVLTNLNEAFASICRDLFVVTCFEMLQSPTITVDEEGEWNRDGPPEMMVDRDSACLYAANEKRIPVHADHSLIAKLHNDPGSEYHSVKEAIELIVHRASGIRYQASTLFHQCQDIYKVFVSAVEAGNQIILAKRFQIELTKFELWGRLSDIVSIRSLPNTNESEDYRLEDSARQMFKLLQEITDEGTLGKRFGINILSSSYQSQSDIKSTLNSPANATPTSFPPTEACLNSLRFKIDRFQTRTCITSDSQKTLNLLDLLRQVHNAILPSLQYSGCRAFDQLFTAALLRTNSDADFSGVETSDGIIPSDLRRSATLKLLGLEMKSGILERLKRSASLKWFPRPWIL